MTPRSIDYRERQIEPIKTYGDIFYRTGGHGKVQRALANILGCYSCLPLFLKVGFEEILPGFIFGVVKGRDMFRCDFQY